MHRYHFAWISAAIWIEDFAQSAHRAKRIAREERVHVRQLVDTDAVLTADRTARVDTRLHDFPHRRVNARRFIRIIRVIADVRMQIAVARMKHIAYVHAVSLGYVVDPGEHLG